MKIAVTRYLQNLRCYFEQAGGCHGNPCVARFTPMTNARRSAPCFEAQVTAWGSWRPSGGPLRPDGVNRPGRAGPGFLGVTWAVILSLQTPAPDTTPHRVSGAISLSPHRSHPGPQRLWPQPGPGPAWWVSSCCSSEPPEAMGLFPEGMGLPGVRGRGQGPAWGHRDSPMVPALGFTLGAKAGMTLTAPSHRDPPCATHKWAGDTAVN